MRRLILSAVVLGVCLSYSPSTFAGVCSAKPEAVSKTNTLPVKYEKLKAENKALQGKLQCCMKGKKIVEGDISNLKAEISQLSTTKEELQNKLNTYPSKEALLHKIQNLKDELGRE